MSQIKNEIDFERALTAKKAVVACGVLLTLVLALSPFTEYGIGLRFLLNLIVTAGLLFTILRFDQKTPTLHLIEGIIYISLTILEFALCGIPGLLLAPGEGISRGTIMDIFIIGLPYVYLGLRIAMALPLVSVFLSAKRLKHSG